MFPINLIPSLNTLSKMLHTDKVVILSEYKYKLGYVLNDLFPYLELCSRHQIALDDAINLFGKCSNLLSYFMRDHVCENCNIASYNDDLDSLMDMQTSQLCLQEVLLIASFCLKYMWQCGINKKDQTSVQEIERLACDYMSNHSVPYFLKSENIENLSEQHKKYCEQGKVFKRAIDTIKSNTKGLSKISWSITQNIHVDYRITQDSEDGSV